MESLRRHLFVNSNKGNETNTQKSKFFLELDKSSFVSHVKNSYEGVIEYMDAWKKFDGAGTHLIDSLQCAVKGTGYEKLGQETSVAFKSVYTSSNGVDPSGKLKEMENLLYCLKNQLESGDETDQCQTNLQILCQCFLLFLKVQLDYHQMCSASIAALLQVLVKSYECSDNKNILQQMKNLDLIPPSSKQLSGHGTKKQGNQSPKLPAQSTFKSSFMSFFERKTSPEENTSNTAFYIDLDKTEPVSTDDDIGCKETDNLKVSDESSTSKTAILVQIDPDPEEIIAQQDWTSISGQHSSLQNYDDKTSLASKEELDSIINLLSASGTSSKHMETIHENQLTVPTLYSSRTPSPGSSDDSRPSKLQTQTQRHSDGSLDLSGFSAFGRNALSHRSSLPSVSVTGGMTDYNMVGYGGTLSRRLSYDVNRPISNSLSPQPSSQILGGSNWTYPDGKYGNNRTWPMNAVPGHCTNTMSSLNSSWSTVQDSDDLSDDSSCGEQFFAMGQDLVNAMDSKNGSSDEEGDSLVYFDDKMKDNPAVAPFPPKQIWSPSNQSTPSNVNEETGNQSHRPLSMQWSDPLANRNVWPSTGSQSMSSYGNFK